MLTRRVIPCLDVDGGRVVKGIEFGSIRDAGDPVEMASRYVEEGADELVFLDITASSQKRATVSRLVSDVARVLDIPFTVGGGVSSMEDARAILLSGADKVGVNTAAVENPGLLTELMDAFGRQCVVLAIDAKGLPGGGYEVRTYGGSRATGRDAVGWAAEGARLGAGAAPLACSQIKLRHCRQRVSLDIAVLCVRIAIRFRFAANLARRRRNFQWPGTECCARCSLPWRRSAPMPWR